METFTLEKDITVYCVPASSFPDGVQEAHETLHALVPNQDGRRYFGISRPEPEAKGKIIYKAAATEVKPGELSKHGLEEFVIKKGKYISITVKDYMKNIQGIGKAFTTLTADPRIDPQGYCIEWYHDNTNVQCMVRLR